MKIKKHLNIISLVNPRAKLFKMANLGQYNFVMAFKLSIEVSANCICPRVPHDHTIWVEHRDKNCDHSELIKYNFSLMKAASFIVQT